MCTDPWFPHDVASDGTCTGECAESPHGTRESGRVAPTGQNMCSVDSGTSEAARSGNSERPLDPQLASTESRPDVSVSAPPVDGLKTAALDLLDVHRAAVEREKRTRLYLILAAREHGLTYEEIGEALDMTGAGVRLFVKRSGGSV